MQAQKEGLKSSTGSTIS